MTLCRLFEGIANEEMDNLVSNVIDIDRHKPKTDVEEKVVVVAFTCDYENVANDLSNFIETGAVEHLDVDVSFSPTRNGKYQVYVEFVRDADLYNKVRDLIYDVTQVTGIEPWLIRVYKSEKSVPFSYENFSEKVAVNPEQYKQTKEIHERIQFLINY